LYRYCVVILAVAASCMEFFADAQRLFVGLGNGTIKVRALRHLLLQFNGVSVPSLLLLCCTVLKHCSLHCHVLSLFLVFKPMPYIGDGCFTHLCPCPSVRPSVHLRLYISSISWWIFAKLYHWCILGQRWPN